MKLLSKISIYHLVILFLLSLYFFGILTFGIAKVAWQAIPPILATTLAGAFFDYLELKRWSKPQTPFITGLIIGLTAQFGESPLVLSLIGASAMTIKFLIKIDGRHIFNPAASGLLIGALLFSSPPSWWVGAVKIWFFLIWVPLLLYKLKRWAPMLGFLLPMLILNGPNLLTSASVLFFISVMLIEPKTSPATVKNGLIYGLVVAVSYQIIAAMSILIDPLIFSLLLGNLTYRLLDRLGIQ